jgi:hypothetical protein
LPVAHEFMSATPSYRSKFQDPILEEGEAHRI